MPSSPKTFNSFEEISPLHLMPASILFRDPYPKESSMSLFSKRLECILQLHDKVPRSHKIGQTIKNGRSDMLKLIAHWLSYGFSKAETFVWWSIGIWGQCLSTGILTYTKPSGVYKYFKSPANSKFSIWKMLRQ